MSCAGYPVRVKRMENHTFLLSHIATVKKKELVQKIKDLGGTYIDSDKFEKNVTHVVFGTLKKTEKYLGACITGKWILSPRFIDDSHMVGMWLEEENYLFRVENKDPVKDQLATTARRWWIQINSSKVVPFQDWHVSVLMAVEKASVFKRLLRYGGAEIIPLKRPFSRCSQVQNVTYVFLDDQHVSYVPELQDLGLLCLKEVFLGDFILKDPPPDPFDYISNVSTVNGSNQHCPELQESDVSKNQRQEIESMATQANVSNTDPAKQSNAEDTPHSSNPSSVTRSSKVVAKTTENTQKNCKRTITTNTQHSIASKSFKKAKVVLEYLDPNLPPQTKIDQVKVLSHKDKNFTRISNHIKNKSQSEEENVTKSSNDQKQSDHSHLYGQSKIENDKKTSAFLAQPSIPTPSVSEKSDTDPQINNNAEYESRSSRGIHVGEKNDSESLIRTPSSSPKPSSKTQSPTTSLKLSPNVYLYGISPSKMAAPQISLRTPEKSHITEFSTSVPANGMTTSRAQKSPNASSTLSPNIYLYGLSPSKDHTRADKMNDNSTKPSSNFDVSEQNIFTSAPQKNTVPSDETLDAAQTSPVVNAKLTGKKVDKVTNRSKERSTMNKNKTPSKKASKGQSSREKGKTMQSFLQQFGFRSTSESKDSTKGSRSQQNLNTQNIKSETNSCENVKLQLNITPENEDGEIIIISSESESESNVQGKSDLKNVVVLSSDSEKDNQAEETSKHLKNPTTCESKMEMIIDSSYKHKTLTNDDLTNKPKIVRNLFSDVFQTTGSGAGNDTEKGNDNNFAGSMAEDARTGPSKNGRDKFEGEKEILDIEVEERSKINDRTKFKREESLLVSSKSDLVSNKYNSNFSKMPCDLGIRPMTTIATHDECDDPSVRSDLLPHVSWPLSFSLNCDSSAATEKLFLPCIISQCMEASREHGFFSTALEHGKPTVARKPNVEILVQFIHLLKCDDVMVKNQAFSDLISWVENHPPIIPSMVKIYSDLFEMSTTHSPLSNLFKELTDIPTSDGNVLLLEFTVAVFEINFSHCLQDADKKSRKECLLIKWLWPHSQAIHHNNKTKQLLRVFEAVMSWAHSMPRAIHAMSVLISIVAECLRLASLQWNTQKRRFLSDTTTAFALDIAKIIRDVYPKEDPFYIVSHILTFKPAWLRTMITSSILSFFDDYLLTQNIQVRDISLNSIVSQYFFLLPPLISQGSATQKLTKTFGSHSLDNEFSNHHDINMNLLKDRKLTALKVNKINGKGESAVHTAAIKGDVATLKKLLSVPGVDVNLKDNIGWTPLHEACNHGRYACVEQLLKFVPAKTLGSFFQRRDGASNKVNIHALGYQNITPLHDAVMSNQVEICRLLLKYGGNCLLESKTEYGNTALDLATTDEMKTVLKSAWNNHPRNYSLNLSQDSQSDDSFNLSQSEFVSLMNNFPSDSIYDEVLNAATCRLASSFFNCSVFVSLITLLLTSYLESTSVTQIKDNNPVKISFLTKDEKITLRKIRFHLKMFRKHLRKISTSDTFDSLQTQLLMLTVAASSSETV